MSQPRFLADEDLRFGIVGSVRRRLRDVEFSTVVEQGFSSSADHDVLEYAWRHRWLLVSHDVGTMKATAEDRIVNELAIHGLFLVPQRHPTQTIAENLVLIAEASEFEEWKNRIVYLPF